MGFELAGHEDRAGIYPTSLVRGGPRGHGLGLSLCLAGDLGRLDTPNRKDYPVVLSVGILQIVGFMGLVHWGLLYVEPGQSAILAYTTPLWVVPLAAIVLKEGFSKLKFLGLLLGLGGLVLLLRPWGPNIGAQINVGDGLLLAAAASWAVAIVHVRGHDWHGDPLLLVPWQMALGAPIWPCSRRYWKALQNRRAQPSSGW